MPGAKLPEGGAVEQIVIEPMRELLEPASPTGQNREIVSLAIAIGPEGGWTDAEFLVATELGFTEAALGINILRTETAVCAALAAAQYAFGAFRDHPSDSLSNGPSDELKSARIKRGEGNP